MKIDDLSNWAGADLYIRNGEGEWLKLGKCEAPVVDEWPDLVLEDILDADLIG